MGEIILVIGFPAAGKTTEVAKFADTHTRLNRDELGGTLKGLATRLRESAKKGLTHFVLDNTFGTEASREPVISAAKELGFKVKAIVLWGGKRFTKAALQKSIEEAQFNAATRMIRKYGKLLTNDKIAKKKDPNCFPPIVLFSYKKRFEQPTYDEGFDEIVIVPFVRQWPENYTNKALILDYDGTLRDTISGAKYPTNPDDVEILPGRIEKLLAFQKKGYRLLGISNQSGVEKGDLSAATANACFDRTNELLGIDIEYLYCPHNSFPINCYCRKPQTGLGVTFIEKYELDPSQCIYVGDRTTDKTFAKRCGFKFSHAKDFFD